MNAGLLSNNWPFILNDALNGSATRKQAGAGATSLAGGGCVIQGAVNLHFFA